MKDLARVRLSKFSALWNGASVKHAPSSRSVSGAAVVEA
jgi:hypothetical protein